MFDSIAAFFRRMFGSGEPESTTPTATTPEQPSVQFEDAPDEIDGVKVLEDGADVFSTEMGERALLPAASRSIGGDMDVSEVIDMTSETGTTEGGVMVAQPRYLWCLDNGHGRLQAGKRSPKFEDGSRFEEWEFNRAIVRGIIAKLEPMGLQFYNVVPEDEIGRFLSGRVKRANNRVSDLGLPKLYVSVHANAAPMKEGHPDTFREDVKGIETFHHPRSSKGAVLAKIFHKHIVSEMGWRDRGVKQQSFFVLANTSMPAVLTENGFYTSKQQATDLLDPTIRQKIIDAHCEAILEIEREEVI